MSTEPCGYLDPAFRATHPLPAHTRPGRPPRSQGSLWNASGADLLSAGVFPRGSTPCDPAPDSPRPRFPLSGPTPRAPAGFVRGEVPSSGSSSALERKSGAFPSS